MCVRGVRVCRGFRCIAVVCSGSGMVCFLELGILAVFVVLLGCSRVLVFSWVRRVVGIATLRRLCLTGRGTMLCMVGRGFV